MKLYNKECPVCRSPFPSPVRHTKYCSPECSSFAQRKIGALRKRRSKRALNRAFHVEWVRLHRLHRDEFIQQNAVIPCAHCGTPLHLKDLEVHHKNGNFREPGPNLEGLCVHCHNIAESLLRTSKSTLESFDPLTPAESL